MCQESSRLVSGIRNVLIDKQKTLKRRTTYWSVRELFSVKWFAVVEGAMGDIRLINTRKGEDMGVMELRKWLRKRMMVNMRKVRSIVEIVGDKPQLQDGDSQQF